MVTAQREEVLLPVFELRGGNLEIFEARESEIVAEGPAGTGKTRSWLELINLLCLKYNGLRVLMLREVQATMPASCIAEFQKRVLKLGDGVVFFGGSKSEPAAFRYPNGSLVVVAGMDNADKVLSSFWDLIYFNEATQTTLEKWETLTTRLRAPEEGQEARTDAGEPFRHRRLCGDCNPSAGKHWLHVRCDRGDARVIHSRLEDNPAYFREDGTPTEAGADYVAKLEKLTGSRYKRFRLGLRVGVENAIYPHFDRELHVRDLEPGLRFVRGAIGVDYGRRHKSASVPISVDQFGRRWVREAWAEPAEPDNSNLMQAVGSQRTRYSIRRGRTDPIQAVLAGMLGFNVADGSAGSRNNRTKIAGRLFNVFPGGRVPPMALELNEKRFLLEFPQPPFVEPDSPGLLFVKGAPGIDELCDQIEDYHEVFVQTERKEDYEVARIDEDLVAALEYGCEELESPEVVYETPIARPIYKSDPRPLPYRGGAQQRQGVRGGAA
jgi:hypothetical protein